MPATRTINDGLIADHVDYLRRWFALGAALSPAALRTQVEAMEATALQELEPARGLVLYLPGHDPKTGQDDGAR